MLFDDDDDDAASERRPRQNASPTARNCDGARGPTWHHARYPAVIRMRMRMRTWFPESTKTDRSPLRISSTFVTDLGMRVASSSSRALTLLNA